MAKEKTRRENFNLSSVIAEILANLADLGSCSKTEVVRDSLKFLNEYVQMRCAGWEVVYRRKKEDGTTEETRPPICIDNLKYIPVDKY